MACTSQPSAMPALGIARGGSLRSLPPVPARHRRPGGRGATANRTTACAVVGAHRRFALSCTCTPVSHVRSRHGPNKYRRTGMGIRLQRRPPPTAVPTNGREIRSSYQAHRLAIPPENLRSGSVRGWGFRPASAWPSPSGQPVEARRFGACFRVVTGGRRSGRATASAPVPPASGTVSARPFAGVKPPRAGPPTRKPQGSKGSRSVPLFQRCPAKDPTRRPAKHPTQPSIEPSQGSLSSTQCGVVPVIIVAGRRPSYPAFCDALTMPRIEIDRVRHILLTLEDSYPHWRGIDVGIEDDRLRSYYVDFLRKDGLVEAKNWGFDQTEDDWKPTGLTPDGHRMAEAFRAAPANWSEQALQKVKAEGLSLTWQMTKKYLWQLIGQ